VSDSAYSGSGDNVDSDYSRGSSTASSSSSSNSNSHAMAGVERSEPPVELSSLWKLAKQADVDGYGFI